MLYTMKVATLLSLVSQGTLGMQSLREEKAALMDCVRRRSFLLEPGTPRPSFCPRLSDRIGPIPDSPKNTESWGERGGKEVFKKY